MLYSIVAVLVLVLDQAVKFYTVRNIPPQAIGDACKTLIPGVIHMTNVQNYGAAFSILENAQTVLIVVSAVFIVGIIILINMDIIHTKFGRWTAVLVMAGALGNCIDRVLLGYVVDMFEFELFNFAVFNVADIFITVCGILFCIHVIVYRESEEERNAVPRPEKKRGKRFAAPQPFGDDLDDEEEDEDLPAAPRRPARTPAGAKETRNSRRERASRNMAAIDASVPHRDRSAHRSLEDDLRSVDPDDPFAEWNEDELALQPQPAGKKAAPVQLADTPPARPAAKGRTAITLDDEDDLKLELPSRRVPAAPKAAAPQKPAAPVQSVELDDDLDGIGFEEYSLDDILSEFRDT